VDVDGRRAVVAGAGWLAGFLDRVLVVPGALDRAGAGHSLGYLTPDEFVLQWTNTNPGLTKSLAH
jgi:hypothetical protein